MQPNNTRKAEQDAEEVNPDAARSSKKQKSGLTSQVATAFGSVIAGLSRFVFGENPSAQPTNTSDAVNLMLDDRENPFSYNSRSSSTSMTATTSRSSNSRSAYASPRTAATLGRSTPRSSTYANIQYFSRQQERELAPPANTIDTATRNKNQSTASKETVSTSVVPIVTRIEKNNLPESSVGQVSEASNTKRRRHADVPSATKLKDNSLSEQTKEADKNNMSTATGAAKGKDEVIKESKKEIEEQSAKKATNESSKKPVDLFLDRKSFKKDAGGDARERIARDNLYKKKLIEFVVSPDNPLDPSWYVFRTGTLGKIPPKYAFTILRPVDGGVKNMLRMAVL